MISIEKKDKRDLEKSVQRNNKNSKNSMSRSNFQQESMDCDHAFLDNSMDNQHRDWFLSKWYEKIIGFRLNKSGSICFVRTDADNKSLEWKWKRF